MKKMTIAIAICTTLTLGACGKSSDPETTTSTTANDSMTEQNAPVSQSAESGTGSSSQGEQAAFEAGSSTESAQGTQTD
jgi:major membrane immunogen (membrane-anchored lipoprotein)